MKNLTVSLLVNGHPIQIDLSTPGAHYPAVSLNTEYPTEIQTEGVCALQITLNDAYVLNPSKKFFLPIDHLSKDLPLKLNIEGYGDFFIDTLPEDFPDFQIVGEGSGFYYSCLFDYIFKMTRFGEMVFSKKAKEPFDFKQTIVNGKTRYSYSDITVSHKNPCPDMRGVIFVKAVVMDETYTVIDEISALHTGKGIPTEHPLELHDFLILGDDHYLISGYVAKRVTNIPPEVPHSKFGARVIASVLQEIQNGELLFQWDSTEHPELYAWSAESNDYYNQYMEWSDYVHFNSVTLDENGHLVCSFRHLNAVLCIKRQPDDRPDQALGSLLWVLGGVGNEFDLPQNLFFSCQHCARFTQENTLTIFDNASVGKALEPPNTEMKTFSEKDWGTESRVLEFTLDTQNKKILASAEYRVEKQYSVVMGSAQKLLHPTDHVFLVGWGGRKTPNALFAEINFTQNQMVFEVLYPHKNPGCDTYRAYWSAT